MDWLLQALGRLSVRRALFLGTILVAAAQMAALAIAAETHKVAQKARAFEIATLTVATGDSVQFVNEDDFIHQIYVDASGFSFDSDETEPGKSVTVRFTTPGTYQVRCHIHPKMLISVTVK